MGRIVLVRHGEAEGNRHHRLIGWSDVGLTAVGHEQAALVARRLRATDVTRIVASDLRRTMQTAEPLVRTLHVTAHPEPRLREIDNGAWTGFSPEQVASKWPELWQRYVDGEDVPRPDGERWADVRRRVVSAIEDYLAEDGTTVIFTHGGPVVISAAWASGVQMEGNVFKGAIGPAENTSLCTIVSGPRLVGYNDVGHLGAIADIDIPYAPVTENDG